MLPPLIIQASSQIPIYEQIRSQIERMILQGSLQENEQLPSVRQFARDYKISALTVKKAYDLLEQDRLIATAQGKGSFVLALPASSKAEERQKQIEDTLEKALEQARLSGLSRQEILDLVSLILEDLK